MELAVFDLTARPSSRVVDEPVTPATPPDLVAYRHAISQACMADNGGMDAYYLTEHHFNPGFHVVPSPHLLVAALSQCTTRIRLGVMCTNLTLHHPVRVCEEIRMLDLLTSGRLEIGFGRGAASHEQTGYGVEPTDAELLFDHSVRLVKDLLSQGRMDVYDRGPWAGKGVVLVPEAIQFPHPPMWMAAVSDTSMAKAAHLGLNVCTAFLDLDGTLRTRRIYREVWDEVHPDVANGRYGTLQHVFVAESARDADRAARPPLEAWFGAARGGRGDDGNGRHSSLDHAVDDGRIVYGTPERCVAQLLVLARSGVDMFQGWFRFGGLEPQASDRSLELFCEEVAPAVRAATRLPVPEPR